jgi:hypothetical protein
MSSSDGPAADSSVIASCRAGYDTADIGDGAVAYHDPGLASGHDVGALGAQQLA